MCNVLCTNGNDQIMKWTYRSSFTILNVFSFFNQPFASFVSFICSTNFFSKSLSLLLVELPWHLCSDACNNGVRSLFSLKNKHNKTVFFGLIIGNTRCDTFQSNDIFFASTGLNNYSTIPLGFLLWKGCGGKEENSITYSSSI